MESSSFDTSRHIQWPAYSLDQFSECEATSLRTNHTNHFIIIFITSNIDPHPRHLKSCSRLFFSSQKIPPFYLVRKSDPEQRDRYCLKELVDLLSGYLVSYNVKNSGMSYGLQVTASEHL